MKNKGWSAEIPNESGKFWFYGDPFKGINGFMVRNQHQSQNKLYMVDVIKNKYNLLIIVDGKTITANIYNQEQEKQGVVGYFKKAVVPDVPDDFLNMFSV